MNYRHSYHAGNFADVMKHVVLALVVEHLKLKSAAFRVIDTHAGIGRYNLSGIEAQKTGEWQSGIGRLFNVPLPDAIALLLAPYLRIIAAENPAGALTNYPGSPLLARRLLRRGDKLVVNELHPEDRELLKSLFAGDPQTKVLGLDGWTALKALLPPKERRGVVLVDPPFEETGEFTRLARALREAQRRFETGTIILWYPIKDARAVSSFRHEVSDMGLAKLLGAELFVRRAESGMLYGTGLIILNPPHTLPDNLAAVLPFLAERLALEASAPPRIGWLDSRSVH
jgi:23S rRNA (adenine2030-N6)-methyltransferase